MRLLDQYDDQVKAREHHAPINRDARRSEEDRLTEYGRQHAHIHRISREAIQSAMHQTLRWFSNEKPQGAREENGRGASGGQEQQQAPEIDQSPRCDRDPANISDPAPAMRTRIDPRREQEPDDARDQNGKDQPTNPEHFEQYCGTEGVHPRRRRGAPQRF